MKAARKPAIIMKIGAFVTKKLDVYSVAVSILLEAEEAEDDDELAWEFDVNDTVCRELRKFCISELPAAELPWKYRNWQNSMLK